MTMRNNVHAAPISVKMCPRQSRRGIRVCCRGGVFGLKMPASQHAVSLQEQFQRVAAEMVVVREHLDQPRQVRYQVALVSVGEDGGDCCCVELNVVVVYFYKVHWSICLDEGQQGSFYRR